MEVFLPVSFALHSVTLGCTVILGLPCGVTAASDVALSEFPVEKAPFISRAVETLCMLCIMACMADHHHHDLSPEAAGWETPKYARGTTFATRHPGAIPQRGTLPLPRDFFAFSKRA